MKFSVVGMCLAAFAAAASLAPYAAAAAAPPPTLAAPLPDAIKSRGKLVVGVKCDYPPFGFVDASGRNSGFEIDIVRRLAWYAFGSEDKVDLECVTGPNRIPYITSGRVDYVVSILSYTPERAKIIAFSSPYFDSGIKLLVEKSSTIKDWEDIRGKTVTTTSGGTQSIWLSKCMPKVKQLLFDNTADSLAALKQGRAVAFPQDMSLLVGITSKNPSLKIVGHTVARGPIGIGMKLGDKEAAAWADAAVADMVKHDFLWKTLTKWVPKGDVGQFKDAVPRPGQKEISYTEANDIYKCD